MYAFQKRRTRKQMETPKKMFPNCFSLFCIHRKKIVYKLFFLILLCKQNDTNPNLNALMFINIHL